MKAARTDRPVPPRSSRPTSVSVAIAFAALAVLLVAVTACSQTEEEAAPTPFPRYELTDEQLKLIPFGPNDLPSGAPALRIAALSGLISNDELADNTFALADSAESWSEAGRVTGHLVELETFDPKPLFVQSGVDLYVDEAAARRGFSLVARDIWETEGQREEGLTFLEIRERPISDLGDEALFQSSRIDFATTATVESIGFRRGNLVAFVQVVTFEGARDEFDVEALARALDERITAVVEGTASWEAVAIPDRDESDRPTAARVRLPDLDDASAPGVDSAPEGVLNPSEQPQASELATWARSFCSIAESTFAHWLGSQDEFVRAVEGVPSVEGYRQATLEYIESLWQSGQDFWLQTSQLTLPERADELGIVALNEAIRLYADWDTSLYEAVMPRIQAASTTGELAGLLVEFAVDASEDPTLLLVDDAYSSVHLSVSVALREASPCGQFESGGFTGSQIA